MLVSQLRSGTLRISEYVDTLEKLFLNMEPVINAFVPEPRRWERIREEANDLEKRYPDPAQRPILYGLPVGLKDIFRVDGLPTRAGSQLPAHVLNGPESTCATQLREAGCLILGKTATTEFAYSSPGPTRNPCNPLHTPGGSSSGSAAAVAAGLVPFALGTQTIGSVNQPAAYCGIVGFKPTYNRISKVNVIENARSHDTVGIFTQDVVGAELIVKVLAHTFVLSDPVEASNVTLGIPIGPYLELAEPAMLSHFHATSNVLEAAGFTVKRIEAMPNFDDIRKRHVMINLREFADYHSQFGEYHHLYAPTTLELVKEGRAVSNEELERSKRCKLETRNHVTELMDEHGLDAWITPGATGPASKGAKTKSAL